MITKKSVLISALGVVAISGALAFGALAQTTGTDMRDVPPFMVNVNANGNVLVRGATVTAISGSTITATTNQSSFMVTWTLQTDGSTQFLRKEGGRGGLSDISVGHLVSFEGKLVAGSQPTVKANIIRNWSIRKVESNQFGQVVSVDSSAKSFVVKADERERGNITVFTSDTTKFLKGERATTTFATLKAGDLVQVHGLWDRNANTIQATWVKIRSEQRRVFEGGILRSTSSSTPPTSIVVNFGRFDYTVNVDTDTAVINQNWLSASLGSFVVGQRIRVYGAADGTTIDATVVRNMDLR